uniref:Uncharacterized protein n=1 Tax=viral metagenome TaxID=1070528 RepID=A0A6C0BJW2_9ZZZZ
MHSFFCGFLCSLFLCNFRRRIGCRLLCLLCRRCRSFPYRVLSIHNSLLRNNICSSLICKHFSCSMLFRAYTL